MIKDSYPIKSTNKAEVSEGSPSESGEEENVEESRSQSILSGNQDENEKEGEDELEFENDGVEVDDEWQELKEVEMSLESAKKFDNAYIVYSGIPI